MRRDRRHLALVLDEHGTVWAGHLEDILEEIEDEFDPRTQALIRPEDGGLRIDGAAPLRMVADELGWTSTDRTRRRSAATWPSGSAGFPRRTRSSRSTARLEVLAVDDTRITALRATMH